MKTHVEFRSDQFPPIKGEDEQTNPGRHGKRLADFLAAELGRQGFEPGRPVPEDWGWLIPVKNDGCALAVGCGQYGDHATRFLCFIEPHDPMIRSWFRRIDTAGPIMALQRAIDKILSSNPAISEISWSTYDEFNQSRQG